MTHIQKKPCVLALPSDRFKNQAVQIYHTPPSQSRYAAVTPAYSTSAQKTWWTQQYWPIFIFQYTST